MCWWSVDCIYLARASSVIRFFCILLTERNRSGWTSCLEWVPRPLCVASVLFLARSSNDRQGWGRMCIFLSNVVLVILVFDSCLRWWQFSTNQMSCDATTATATTATATLESDNDADDTRPDPASILEHTTYSFDSDDSIHAKKLAVRHPELLSVLRGE